MTKRPSVLAAADLEQFVGTFKELVPSVKIDLWENLADDLARWIDGMTAKSTDMAVHGASMSGKVLTLDQEENTVVAWWCVGDAASCEDCLALHGQQMTMAEFLDLKYTTQCNGNCRCEPLAAGEVGGDGMPMPITNADITAALGE